MLQFSFDGIAVVELLINSGADVNLVIGGTKHVALVSALHQEKIEATKLLVESGSNVNHVDANGETPIMRIAYFDREDHVRCLLENGASVKGRNIYSGDEILHHAAFGGFPGMIRLLIGAGAEINVTNKEGNTPLQVAHKRGKNKAVQELLKAGAV